MRVSVHDPNGTKLDGHAKIGHWVGYDGQSKGHRIYWPEKCTVTIERNVDFIPTEAVHLEGESDAEPSAEKPKTPAPPSPPASPTIEEVPDESEPDVPPPDLLTKRVRRPTQYVCDIREGVGSATGLTGKNKLPPGLQAPPPDSPPKASVVWESEIDGLTVHAFAAIMADVEGLEPRNLVEARRRPEWLKWDSAIKEEIDSLIRLDTWDAVDPPPDVNIVGSKWVFRAKRNATGEVERYKARLVAQGFSQVPRVDYFDTYAPIAKLASIRTVLAMAARHDYEIHQVDIKSVYLNGEFTHQETIYMRQPPGYPVHAKKNKVLLLKKPLYGLKQSGRCWYQKLYDVLKSLFSLAHCQVDHAVFFHEAGNSLIIVVVHVDDLTVVTSSVVLMTEFKSKLRKKLEITDLGEIHWLLGIKILRDRAARTISLAQTSYIDSIVKRYGLQDSKTVSIPMDPNVCLSPNQSPSTPREFANMCDVPYREAVGSLMYAAIGTRLDITYAVGILSRFIENPGHAHWEAAKRVFRYLKGTRSLRLTYGGSEAKGLVGYADMDGSMNDDRRAISGYAFLIDGGAVSWSSKRQEIIVLSTTEAEYVAATHAAKETKWLRTFIGELFTPLKSPTTLYSDSQSAITLSEDHQYHARMKHINIRFHFIRWVIEDGVLKLVYCPTDDMTADTLTKALPSAKAKHFAHALGLRTA